MPPMRDSRFEHCRAIRDDAGNLYLTEREPYRFRPLPDTRLHIVTEGETLYTIAGRYFRPRPRACGLWWIIADFQPDPILDPTLRSSRAAGSSSCRCAWSRKRSSARGGWRNDRA